MPPTDDSSGPADGEARTLLREARQAMLDRLPPGFSRPGSGPSEGGAVVYDPRDPRKGYSRCMLVGCSSAAARTPCLKGGPTMGECCCNPRLRPDGTLAPQPARDHWGVRDGGPVPPPEPEPAPPQRVFGARMPPLPPPPGGPWIVSGPQPIAPYYGYPEPGYGYADPGYAPGWPAAPLPAAPPPMHAPAPVIHSGANPERTVSAADFRVHIEGTGFSWGVART